MDWKTQLEDKQELLSGQDVLDKKVPRHRRKTLPRTTKYERARLLGSRSAHIGMGAPVLVKLDQESDSLDISSREIKEKKLPVKIRRIFPDNTYEDWDIDEFEQVEEQPTIVTPVTKWLPKKQPIVPDRPIRVTLGKLTKDELSLRLEGVDLAFANSLRRVLFAEVPTLAIDEIDVEVNRTSMDLDYFIALELGLVPLVSKDIDQYNMPRECDCTGGCLKCTVDYTLDVDNTDGETVQYINASSIKPVDPKCTVLPVGYDDPLQSVHLFKLGPGMKLKLKCKARKGTAKSNAKWGASVRPRFVCPRIVTLNESALSKVKWTDKLALDQTVPKGVFVLDEKTQAMTLNKDSKWTNFGDFITLAQKISPSTPLISVQKVPFVYDFTVATTGALTARDLFERSVQILKQKVSSLRADIKVIDRQSKLHPELSTIQV